MALGISLPMHSDHGDAVVFVYGTLLSGEANHALLTKARFIAKGRTLPEFTLYDLGDYPGLVRHGRHAIVGELYSVAPPLLRVLDEFEEHPQFYRRTRIGLQGGLVAQAYLLSPARIVGFQAITHGSWRARNRPSNPPWATPAQAPRN